MMKKRPAVIAQATGVADVIAAVDFAREHRILTAVRGGGHNVAGNATVDGGLVIDLTRINNVHVDPVARRARVGGGCTLGDVDRETQVHGLAAPLGVVSQTGVAGLTLCGGLGWLRRRFGLACDNVVAFEVVSSEGRVVRAAADENPDLYWALKGGGGNFGVVTSFEFQLHPVGPEVVLVSIMYPIDRALDYLPIWRDFMAKAPAELATNFLFWTLPDWEVFPSEVRGRDVCIIGGCWTGNVDEGMALVEPLRNLETPLLDLTGPASWCAAQGVFDPFFNPGERQNYWKCLYIDRLDGDVLEVVMPRVMAKPDPWMLIASWYLGGAMAKVPAEATAFGDRSAPYLFSLDSGWVDPAKNEDCIRWTREFWEAMKPFSPTGGCYLNFPGFGEEGEDLLRDTYGAGNYARLQQVKAKWDPGNLFRLNQNIKPAALPQAAAQ